MVAFTAEVKYNVGVVGYFCATRSFFSLEIVAFVTASKFGCHKPTTVVELKFTLSNSKLTTASSAVSNDNSRMKGCTRSEPNRG